MTLRPGDRVRAGRNEVKLVRRFRNGMWLVEDRDPNRGFCAYWEWELTVAVPS